MKLCIAIPAKHIAPIEFLINFLPTLARVNKFCALDLEKDIKIDTTTPLDVARCNLVDYAMQGGYSHIWFIDVDTVPQVDAFEKLLHRNKEIVGGLYVQSCEPYNVVGKKDGKLIDPQPNQLIEVDFMGLGCCLLRTEVFKNITTPYFKFEEGMGEDAYFFSKCRILGNYKVYLDTSVLARHFGGSVGIENYEWCKRARNPV